MGWFGNKSEQSNLEWKKLESSADLDQFNRISNERPVVFFKHSTRCSISAMAKNRFERDWNYNSDQIIPVYLDLLKHRDLSNALSSMYGIEHESPQILVVKKGICIFNASHSAINSKEISRFLD